MAIISLEEEDLEKLITGIADRISMMRNQPINPWISMEEALNILNRGKTSLQKLRDENKIVFTKDQKPILYDIYSILSYLEKNSNRKSV